MNYQNAIQVYADDSVIKLTELYKMIVGNNFKLAGCSAK